MVDRQEEQQARPRLLKGAPVAERIAAKARATVAQLAERGVVPGLAILRVGERPDDLSYERTLIKRAAAWGVDVHSIALAADASQEAVEQALRSINKDSRIHGCLMFRPLPPTLDEAALCEVLDPAKDIDGITSASLAALFMGALQGTTLVGTPEEACEEVGDAERALSLPPAEVAFAPSTAQACLEVLDGYGVPIAGQSFAVVGRSLVVGRPLAMLLLARNATVTLCHSRTEDLPSALAGASTVVCATGRARGFDGTHFQPGQTIVDVGINFDEAGTLCGDVDFESAVEKLGEAGALTPVPGGVGSITTAVTLAHVIQAAARL